MSARIGLLGASGYTGGLVARVLAVRGHPFVAAGRDPRRVHEAVAGLTGVEDVRAVDVDDDRSVRALLDAVDVVITTVGPFDRLGRGVLTAAADAGTHYVDSTGEQGFIAWAYDTQDARARASGASLVPAAGFDFLPGDLLAALAAEPVSGVREVHVAYAVPGLRSGTASSGTRRTLAGMLGEPVVALVGGHRVEEQLAETRRLAWFPRPVGPRHAAGFPGAEPITVPRHLPGVSTVRSYLALTTAAAEGLQLLGNAARWAPLRRAVTRVLDRGARGGGPDAEVRARTRWACVAEAAGDDELGRAWAYGTDPYGLTAEAMVSVAERLLAGDAPAGVVPPATVGAPGDLLDDLAARSDLRWRRARSDHRRS